MLSSVLEFIYNGDFRLIEDEVIVNTSEIINIQTSSIFYNKFPQGSESGCYFYVDLNIENDISKQIKYIQYLKEEKIEREKLFSLKELKIDFDFVKV